jgi:hypothetical protein
MARILEANLAITREARRDLATITGRVEFTPGEINLGLDYAVHVLLVEVDEGIDRYAVDLNGFQQPLFISYLIGEGQPEGMTRIAATGDADEAVLSVGRAVIRPSRSGPVAFSESLPITPAHRESGAEEYQAVVWVVPEVCMGMRKTNQVSINLG